jgi:parvulin-like peptidyl-prolyl isomerase
VSYWFSVRTSARGAAVLLAALVTLLAACKSGDPGEAVVAEVGDEEITVAEVADFMARRSYGVNAEDVSKAVDELINLELVRLRARERYIPLKHDSLQMTEWNEILVINQFRDEVVWADIQVDETKLREWYDENVQDEVQARHILVSVPATATDAERTAARREADSLLTAVKADADFAEAARGHSDDPGSGQNGGLLPWFGKGQMVEPFENAAFEGTAGEIYPELVETQFGFHIIKVENRRRPAFEDLRDQIEEQLMGPQRTEVEQAYITQLMENSGVEFYESNIDTLIVLFDADPPRPVTGDHRALDLATFRNEGSIKLGEIWDLYQTLPPANQRSIESLDQTQMIQALASMVQQKLLLGEARAKSVELDTTRARQLRERTDALYMESYMRQVGQSILAVPDSVVQRYYEEHREFYSGRPFEEVREQIREVLMGQRMETLSTPDAESRILAAVADSQASEVEVVRHEDRYDDVLEALRAKYEEIGRDPNAVEAPATPAPAQPVQPAQPTESTGADSL